MERSKIEGDFVLDSSVIIKWFSDEEDTDISLELRENYIKGNANIASPDLIIYEIANALRYNKELSETDVKNSINSLISMGINIIVPTKMVIESRQRLDRLKNDPFANADDIIRAEQDLEYLDSLYQNFYFGMNVFRTAKGGRDKLRE